MLASRLRLVSKRLAFTTLRPIALNTCIKPASAVPNLVRSYSSEKQVSYTVDKFPGYVRHENYKKVFIICLYIVHTDAFIIA